MSEDDLTRTFWCPVDGDVTPFYITISVNASICQLKEPVREMAVPATIQVDATDMALWKTDNSSMIRYLLNLVSGTGLPLAELQGSINFYGLRSVKTWPKLKPFLERYVPASILETPSGYRFSVSFLECFLRNGLESPHKLLNEYINGYTTCLPGDTGDPYTLDEPELHIDVPLMGFEWDRLRLDSVALQEAAQIVQSHLTLFPTFGPTTARLVVYGIACLRDGKGHIVEALAFLSLTEWLQTQDRATLEANIQFKSLDD